MKPRGKFACSSSNSSSSRNRRMFSSSQRQINVQNSWWTDHIRIKFLKYAWIFKNLSWSVVKWVKFSLFFKLKKFRNFHSPSGCLTTLSCVVKVKILEISQLFERFPTGTWKRQSELSGSEGSEVSRPVQNMGSVILKRAIFAGVHKSKTKVTCELEDRV